VFVHKYLENLSAKTRDGVGLPSESQRLGQPLAAQCCDHTP
jgi:hypothetical protein